MNAREAPRPVGAPHGPRKEACLSRSERWIAVAAWVAFAISFFLPVLRGHEVIGGLDAGWKAFLMAASMAITPDRLDGFWALCVAGVLANVMVALSPWALRAHRIPLGYMLLVLVALSNGAWSFLIPRSDLEAGYWMWNGSIVALGALVVRRHRILREAAPAGAPARSPELV